MLKLRRLDCTFGSSINCLPFPKPCAAFQLSAQFLSLGSVQTQCNFSSFFGKLLLLDVLPHHAQDSSPWLQKTKSSYQYFLLHHQCPSCIQFFLPRLLSLLRTKTEEFLSCGNHRFFLSVLQYQWIIVAWHPPLSCTYFLLFISRDTFF